MQDNLVEVRREFEEEKGHMKTTANDSRRSGEPPRAQQDSPWTAEHFPNCLWLSWVALVVGAAPVVETVRIRPDCIRPNGPCRKRVPRRCCRCRCHELSP